MPGILPHLGAAIICMIVVHCIHFKWEFSWSIFVGNFIPDAIKFGFVGLVQGTFSILLIEKDEFYRSISNITSNPTNWFSLGFFIIGMPLVLYHFHVIKKKKMEEYDELYVFFLIGIIIHLVMDLLFVEKGIWY
ncbi:MAG: hypothetical protein KKF44_10195 [Nanoarchaeota archaeon]|nr:hypothetical protein [Nanoarchaeota archaeon]